jgi:hypothetical protein
MTAAVAPPTENPWWRRTLLGIFIASFFTQNAIAIPYVRENGPKSALDFFGGGEITKTVPGRFAIVDLGFVVLGFHAWALAEARRQGIIRWWVASLVLTFSVGIATAIPFFLLAHGAAVRRTR